MSLIDREGAVSIDLGVSDKSYWLGKSANLECVNNKDRHYLFLNTLKIEACTEWFQRILHLLGQDIPSTVWPLPPGRSQGLGTSQPGSGGGAGFAPYSHPRIWTPLSSGSSQNSWPPTPGILSANLQVGVWERRGPCGRFWGQGLHMVCLTFIHITLALLNCRGCWEIQLTLEQQGGGRWGMRGTNPPCSQKSKYNLWLPQNLAATSLLLPYRWYKPVH